MAPVWPVRAGPIPATRVGGNQHIKMSLCVRPNSRRRRARTHPPDARTRLADVRRVNEAAGRGHDQPGSTMSQLSLSRRQLLAGGAALAALAPTGTVLAEETPSGSLTYGISLFDLLLTTGQPDRG